MNPEINPENTNDMGQDVAKPNPNQNIMNQNTTLPSPNLQLAQVPFAQNLPLQASPSKSKRPILITCVVGVLVLIIAIVGIVCAVLVQNDEDNDPVSDTVSDTTDDSDESAVEKVDSDTADNVTLDIPDVVDVEKFKQMTKAKAVSFLQAGRGAAGSMPKNYVDKEITDLVIVKNDVVLSDVSLKYSYETIDDLRQIAEKWYGVLGHNDGITEDDYEIKEYDYYAIVIPNRIEGTNTCDHDYYGDCDSLLSFKSDYLNHFQAETAPHSYNDVAYLNTQNSPELIEHLLRTYSLFSNYGIASGHGNIYGSNFEERDDDFVLTVYYVGVGLNMDKLKEGNGGMDYAINLYSRQYAADRVDGRVHIIRTGEDSANEHIRSIPITQKEATLLLSR